MGYVCTKKRFVVYLTFQFDWVLHFYLLDLSIHHSPHLLTSANMRLQLTNEVTTL